MRYTILFSVLAVLVTSGCIQVNIPRTESKETVQYTLLLPETFQAPDVSLIITEFSSESPAKFKMLSRKDSVLQQDSFAKWTMTPAVMVSAAFRKLYHCDDADYQNAQYFLSGNIFTFERNLDTKTADLKIRYTLVNRQLKKIVFVKELVSAVPLPGDSSADFAAAMSKAVVEQAEKIRQEIDKAVKQK